MRFVDVHCHCLPRLDDGPASMAEALALCRDLVEDSISTVVATPHQLGCFDDGVSAEAIRRATRRLNSELVEQRIDLAVLPGAEVRVDERIDDLLDRDEVLTLADAGRYVLLELPWDVLIDIEPLLVQLAYRDMCAIIAHPERNIPLLRSPHVLSRWRSYGVGLQVTAASLTGRWGRYIKRAAWELIRQGWVVTVATDAHGDGSSPPDMTNAFQALAARWGCDLARLLCVENPAQVIRGEEVIPVAVPNQEGFFRRRR